MLQSRFSSPRARKRATVRRLSLGRASSDARLSSLLHRLAELPKVDIWSNPSQD